jgi:DNA polymerase
MKCVLCESGHSVVNGVGPRDARIFFVGEAPGKKEDELGKPFVGRSGRFFDSMLINAGVSREEVFITNIVRCRPPNNRKPTKKEMEACLPYLMKEIKSVGPYVIVTLGSSSLNALTGYIGRLADVVGDEQPVEFCGIRIPVIPCYHPSAAMRNRELKMKFAKVISQAVSAANRTRGR